MEARIAKLKAMLTDDTKFNSVYNKELFAKFSTNNLIDATQLEQLMVLIAEKQQLPDEEKKEFTKEAAEKIIPSFDSDKDGKLVFEEFIALIRKQMELKLTKLEKQ